MLSDEEWTRRKHEWLPAPGRQGVPAEHHERVDLRARPVRQLHRAAGARRQGQAGQLRVRADGSCDWPMPLGPRRHVRTASRVLDAQRAAGQHLQLRDDARARRGGPRRAHGRRRPRHRAHRRRREVLLRRRDHRDAQGRRSRTSSTTSACTRTRR